MSFGELFFINCSFKNTGTVMNLCSLDIKWKDPKQQAITDPNVADFHVTLFITWTPSTDICGFFFPVFPCIINQIGKSWENLSVRFFKVHFFLVKLVRKANQGGYQNPQQCMHRKLTPLSVPSSTSSNSLNTQREIIKGLLLLPFELLENQN